VRCHDHGPKVSVHLDAIARLAEAKAKEPIRSRVLEAVFVCRKNCHSASAAGRLPDKKHCEFVVAALRFAIKASNPEPTNWEKAEQALRHGTGEIGALDLPGAPREGAWPDHLCGDLTAAEMLLFIELTVNGPTGPKNPDGTPNTTLINQILDEITECRGHPAGSTPDAIGDHCQHVAKAYTESTKLYPRWSYVLKELDHMVY
jgi:hypothetical protein